MTEKKVNDRRRFLKVAGGAALTVPLASLTACSGDDEPAPPPEPAAATPPPEAPAPEHARRDDGRRFGAAAIRAGPGLRELLAVPGSRG